MIRVTKETCVGLLEDYLKLDIPVYFGYLTGAVVLSWWLTQRLWVTILVLALGIVFSIFLIKRINEAVKNVYDADFYLVEDTVIDFKKRIDLGRRAVGSRYNYIYTFKNNGKYQMCKSKSESIRLFAKKQKRLSRLDVAELSTDSCETGDLFYLLILNKQGKNKIVSAFYRYHFELKKEDFDLIDGKYYCKADRY